MGWAVAGSIVGIVLGAIVAYAGFVWAARHIDL